MKRKKANWEVIILCLILVFAFFLRVYQLGVPSLWVDEATSGMAAKMILEKGIPVFDSGLLYDRAFVFHYLTAFFLLFGQTDFLVRFASVIFGLLTVLLAYFIGREYSKSGGIISALFMSAFYLEVFFSRQARFYQLFQLMFFLSIYLLYKSKKNPNYIYLALISFFITLDTQVEGLVLAPFFIWHILAYSKKWKKYLAIIPGALLLFGAASVLGVSALSVKSSIIYAQDYLNYTGDMIYILVLSVMGLIWAYARKKKLTLMIVLPSLLCLVGIFSLQTFALRYSYFFVFPLILYSSLLVSFLYEKYGKIMLAVVLILLIVPSNLFFPYTYTNWNATYPLLNQTPISLPGNSFNGTNTSTPNKSTNPFTNFLNGAVTGLGNFASTPMGIAAISLTFILGGVVFFNFRMGRFKNFRKGMFKK